MATTYSTVGARSSVATCTTGTEAPPADAVADAGLNLDAVTGFMVTVSASAGQTITGVGQGLLVWYRDRIVQRWSKVMYLTDILTGGRDATPQGPSAGLGLPAIGASGQVVVLPQGMTTSAGGLTVTLTAEGERGGDL